MGDDVQSITVKEIRAMMETALAALEAEGVEEIKIDRCAYLSVPSEKVFDIYTLPVLDIGDLDDDVDDLRRNVKNFANDEGVAVWHMFRHLRGVILLLEAYSRTRLISENGMATLADVRKAALALPRAVELNDHGGNWFNVRTKTFVVYGFPSARWIFKLPKSRQELLFEARPEVFQPYRAGTMLWSYVDITKLSRVEVADFVTDAWTTVVSKKVASDYLARRDRPVT